MSSRKKTDSERSSSSNAGGGGEQKEVEKYIKFFTLKALQSVINSRTGSKSNTKCNPTAKGLDWFNISLPESDANRKFQSTAREQFGKKVAGLYKPICLDIVLKTSEGSYTVLETWQVASKPVGKDDQVKNHITIYNRLGVLLKSVIAMSRVLPSYQLARKQDSDFTLFFKVHSEVYPLQHYELNNAMPIGSVATPIGEVSIKALYRSKVWLNDGSMHSLNYVIDDTSALIPLVSDKDMLQQNIDANAENEIALAVSDISPCVPNWFSMSSSGSGAESSKYMGKVDIHFTEDKEVRSDVSEAPSLPSSLKEESIERPIPAFAEPFQINVANMPMLDLPELPSTPPFSSLLQDSPDAKIISFVQGQEVVDLQESEGTVTCESSVVAPEVEVEPPTNIESPLIQRRAEAVGFEDDFVLVELRPAFCSDNDTVGSLFRQCQSPATLDMFAALEKEDEESECIDLDTQLEIYRKEIHEFENYFNVIY